MTTAEHNERRRLHDLWATGRATRAQIERCQELDQKDKAEIAKVYAMHDGCFTVEEIVRATDLSRMQVVTLIRAREMRG